ncbi:MAG: sigma-70 family RNA polymerase sigma factor [Planctomycetes bacterium]|nr:sigma-70 family RNA polymerase sigma factor [Planctomycetota bacterium]
MADGPARDPTHDELPTHDALIGRYQRRVHAVIYRMTGRHADVDDLCQETFLQVFRGLGKLPAGSNLDGWVYRVALNVSIDHLRRRTKQRALERDPAAARGPTRAAPVQVAAGQELEQAVRRALDELPDDQRAVVVLRMYEGLSHEEIGSIQGVPVATVRWRLFAARRKLEALLAPFLDGPAPGGE